jgi:hypothetical protein
MKVEEVRIDSISNHSKNPKQHPEKQLRLLEESIKRFGWTNPVNLVFSRFLYFVGGIC